MTDRRTDRQTDGQTDARGKTICLPTLSGGDIMTREWSVEMSLRMREKRQFEFPTMSDINRPVQPQKRDSSLKFWIEEEEEL